MAKFGPVISTPKTLSPAFRRRRPLLPHRVHHEYVIEDFVGLNSLDADNKLAKGELTEAFNCRYGKGYVEKRPGFSTVADQTSTVTGGISNVDVFTSRAGVETIMVYFPVLGDLYRVNGAGLTAVTTTLTPGTMANVQGGVSYQDAYYFANGKDTGLTKVTSAFVVSNIVIDGNPKCTGIVEFLDRLYAWGDATKPQRLYYSASLNGDDWATAAAGFLDVPGNIISVVRSGASLIVTTTKENGEIISAYGNNPNYRTIEASSQATSQRAFIGVKNSVIYMAEQGLKSIGQTAQLPRGSYEGDLSRIIRPDFRRLAKGAAAGVYGKNEHTLWMALKGSSASTYNDTLLALDDELGRFSYDVGINALGFAVDKAGTIYFGDETQAKVYAFKKIDPFTATNYSDNGTAVNFSVATGWISPVGDPDTTCLLRDVRLYFRTNSGTKIDVDLMADYGGRQVSFSTTLTPPSGVTPSSIWAVPLFGTNAWTASGQALNGTFRYFQRKAPVRMWFNFLKVRVRNNEDNKYVRLEGIKIVSIPRPGAHYGRPSITSDIINSVNP